MVIFEETEPFVEGLFKRIFHEEKIEVEVLGRSGFVPSDGELTRADDPGNRPPRRRPG